MNVNQIEFKAGTINAGDCVTNAWQDIREDYWFYFGVSIVAWLISFASGMIPVLSIIIAPIIGGPLFAGVFAVFLAKADGEKKEFGGLFDGFKKFLPAMIVGLVLSIPGILLQVYQLVMTIRQFVAIFSGGMSPETLSRDPFPTLVIGLYVFLLVYGLTVGLLLFFSLFLIMDHGLNARDAITLSARAAYANLGGLILLVIIEGLLLIAGALACLLGIFFIMPMVYLVSANAYRQVFPRAGSRAQPVLTPPSPDVYADLQEDKS